MKSFPNLVEEKIAPRAETREEIEERAKQELVEKGRAFENVEFKFIEPRLRVKPEQLPHNLDWNLFSKNISDEEKERLTHMFNKLEDYLDALIITDNFEYHDDRGNWEKKYRNELSPEAWDIYKNNHLGLTNASRPVGLLEYISIIQDDYQSKNDLFIKPEVLSQLKNFVKMTPPEIRSGNVYGKTSLDRKIKIADQEMTLVFSAVIRTLGERIPKAKN